MILVDQVGRLDLDQAADSGRPDTTDPGDILLVKIKTTVRYGLIGTGECEMRETVQGAGMFYTKILRCIEILDLGTDVHREVLRVEGLKDIRTALTIQQGLPELLDPGSNRGQGSQPGNNNTTAHGSLIISV